MAIEYNFKYMPLVGKLSGESMVKQTETAINEIAKIVNDNTAQAEIINTLAEQANANSVEALEKATEALDTSSRVYIKETLAVNLNNYCESQLIYINNVFSQNLPVAHKGFLEVKTNDDKTQATQVFADDVDRKFYVRTGAITATTVGDVTTYTASYGNWVSIPNITDLDDYLALVGGTMSGDIQFSASEWKIKGSDIDNDAELSIVGATDNLNGSSLNLYGRNHTESGAFELNANNGTYTKTLKGTATGNLTWDGNVTADNFIGDGATITGTASVDGQVNVDGVVSVKNGSDTAVNTLQRSTAYAVDDIVYTSEINARYYLLCTTAGTTASTLPSFANVQSNTQITDGTVVWRVQTVTSQEKAAGFPVGFEYFSMNPNVPQGSLPLFGGEYSRATYADLWAWVQEQSGYLKTEADWQDLATANNGNVPYYSSGDGSTTFRVPSLKCWVKGANGTVTEVGSYLAAGLPNITGSFRTRVTNYNDGNILWSNSGGAIYDGSRSTTTADTLDQINGSKDLRNINFDASRSSSIYGNSSTVQPESIVGMWLVKAYGTVVDTGTIDEQQYIDDRIATCLPLTGGTMLGAIHYNGANNRSFGLDLTNNFTNMDIGWNWTNRDGAGIGLRSTDDISSTAGSFVIYARDENNDSSLKGYPNGSLTWGGYNVMTSAGGAFTGNVTISKDYGSFNFVNTGFAVGDTITADKTLGAVWINDKNGRQVSSLIGLISNGGHVITITRACKNTSALNIAQTVVRYPASGDPSFQPGSDNTMLLGNAGIRWKQLYAGTSTINTSDERVKDNIEVIPDNVLDAWGDVNWYQFQFKDAIAEKGENARIHTGAIAQRIKDVFESHGLDAFRYGLLCYDEWEETEESKDENGDILMPAQEAGNMYSLRYEEALCMEAAYQRRRADRLEERIEALERAING